MYASNSMRGFYDPTVHDQMPDDAFEISAEKHRELLDGESEGKVICWVEDGCPFLADPPPPAPLTRDQVEANRLRAYADPLTGSDRFFSEASRMQATGGTAEEIETSLSSGAARHAEIQSEHPWPE